MADIRTDVFQSVSLKTLIFRFLRIYPRFNQKAYAKTWQDILIEVRLLESTSTGNDVVIARRPRRVKGAVSAYGIVASIEWSANNGDFTKWSRTVDLATLKPIINRLVKERIVPRFFPELIGKKMAFNVWLKRWDSAAFCIGIA